MHENLVAFARKHLPHINDTATIEKLFGQASARQYFRISCSGGVSPPADSGRGNPATTNIIMQLPQGFSSPAEEITKMAASAPKEFPFINVQRYLKSLEVNVPAILGYDADLGLILLEDIGDESLERVISKTDETFKIFYYKKVIETLIDLQIRTAKNPSADCVAYHRRFDADLLHWEIMHFLEYGIEDRFKIKVENQESSSFDKAARDLVEHITKLPYGFTHRDFQSRNIHFFKYEFYLIDFQDALLGPVIYDLVALLRDSYVKFSPEQRDALIEHYVANVPEGHPYHDKLAQAKNDFHLVALQRKLKDTGRFQYINTVRGNPNFLKSVPQSLAYVKEAFDVLRRGGVTPPDSPTAILHTIAVKYVEELR